MKRALRPWWPLFVWVALIFGLSSIPRLPGDEAGLPPHADKVAHAVEYLVLAVLFHRGLRTGRGWSGFLIGLVTVVTCLAIAALDELYQSYRPERDSNVWDLAADGVGILVGTVATIVYRRLTARTAGARRTS